MNMDPGHIGWQNYLSEAALRGLDDGLDGVYLDDAHDSVPSFYYERSWPINTRTGQRYTDGEWNASTLQLLQSVYQRVRNTYPNPDEKLVLFNGTISRSLLRTPFVDMSDGIIIEGFAHPYWKSGTDYESESLWKAQIDALVGLARRGKLVLAIAGTADGDDEDMNMFTCASFLLGDSPYSLYNYAGFEISAPIWPGFLPILGSPVDAYYRAEKLYQRDFTAAKVIVNPTPNHYYINLDKPYYPMSKDGSIASDPVTAVSLAPYSSSILFIASPLLRSE
jgi:hypothetical protein